METAEKTETSYFNQTIVELKSANLPVPSRANFHFNQTIVELKSKALILFAAFVYILIRPLWN